MSSSMYWRPAPTEEPPAHGLPTSFKKTIAQRMWGHDGSLFGEKVEVGRELVPYLEGLVDGGSGEIKEGAEELLAAIAKHGRVEIWIGP